MHRPTRRGFYNPWWRCYAADTSTVSFYAYAEPVVLMFPRQLARYFFLSNFLAATSEQLLVTSTGKLHPVRTHHPKQQHHRKTTVLAPTCLTCIQTCFTPTEPKYAYPTSSSFVIFSVLERTFPVHRVFQDAACQHQGDTWQLHRLSSDFVKTNRNRTEN